jgi:23S rRNA (cytidine1920-2'-O)/16S rRNA (cytidine1409-2'-O)-methyltransferase
MSPKIRKQRLDVALVERRLVDTRSKAQALIMARRVTVNGLHVTKSGAVVAAEDLLAIEALEHPWVGRGGMKLDHALREFEVSVEGRVCADIGASTGGFTHVLLAHGAGRVYAIDVGYGQLDASIRNDPRVISREKVNARYLEPGSFPETIEVVTVDVSFISLTLILPAVATFLSGDLIALIKPQFEVGRSDLGKGGIVRDERARAAAVDGVVAFARTSSFAVQRVIPSPIKGAEGNVEFLMWATGGSGRPLPD